MPSPELFPPRRPAPPRACPGGDQEWSDLPLVLPVPAPSGVSVVCGEWRRTCWISSRVDSCSGCSEGAKENRHRNPRKPTNVSRGEGQRRRGLSVLAGGLRGISVQNTVVTEIQFGIPDQVLTSRRAPKAPRPPPRTARSRRSSHHPLPSEESASEPPSLASLRRKNKNHSSQRFVFTGGVSHSLQALYEAPHE